MSPPVNPSLPLLPILLLLLLLLPPSTAQFLKVAFPKFSTPAGWLRYTPANLSTPISFGFIPTVVPGPFHSHVKSSHGFTYRTTVPPGHYTARLGFLQNEPCYSGGRVFHFVVNGVDSGEIDLFRDAGCLTPYMKDVKFHAPAGGVVVRAVPDAGWAPMLSNLQIFKRPIDEGNSVAAGTGPVPPPASEVNVSFSKNKIPNGWTRFDEDRLSGDVIFVEGSPHVQDTLFRNQIKAKAGLSYNHVIRWGVYDVELWFMELNRHGCKVGKRVFKAEVNGKETHDIDVFASAGCRIKHRILFSDVRVEEDGLNIVLKPVKGFAPFLANFVVRPASGKSDSVAIPPRETPSSAPSATTTSEIKSPVAGRTNIEIGTGTRSDAMAPAGTKPHYFPGAITAKDDSTVPLIYYKTARYGKDFSYSFALRAGAYDITLGFIENYSPHCGNGPGKRVFNVYVNDAIQIESYDIYDEVGCYHGVEHVIEKQTVPAIDTKPLTIRFEAVTNNAVVSFIRIETAVEDCIPVSMTGEILSDHAAHAVPGTYPPLDASNSASSYVDSDGDGYEWVDVDGSGSHTHFFDSENNIIGKLTSYTWTIAETREVLSRGVSFRHKFPLGTTRLKLAVVDNSCTTDEAETTVTVTGKIQPGQYCYYYSGLKAPPMGGMPSSTARPSFAHVAESLDLGFPSFYFDAEDFAVSCHFFLERDVETKESTISIDTGGTGIAKVYKGDDVILDTETSTSMTTVKTALAAGLTFFKVAYYRSGSLKTDPKLAFLVDGFVPDDSAVSYDRTTVVPILTDINPREGKVSGGTKVKLGGYGLFRPLTVLFGYAEAEVSADASQDQVFVNSPASRESQVVSVTVTTPGGLASNAIPYRYEETNCDEVAFQEQEIVRVVREGGEEVRKSVDLRLPTCAVLSGDGALYVGTLGGTVQVLRYDADTLIATSQCYSEAIRDAAFRRADGGLSIRDILGIAFDPRDNPPRPYVSTSTLYWRERAAIEANNTASWRNGAVDRLMHTGTTMHPVDAPGVCLLYDARIVSGLPVSNHDHGVNGLLFTQSGDLLINVGGMTNSGLPGVKLGGLWETALSAAVVIARLSQPGFDGDIEYTDPADAGAGVKTGDVELFATGLRNAFPVCLTRNGEVWVTDQGPNCGFGDTASACDEYEDGDEGGEVMGRVMHGWKGCPYGPGRRDKVIKIQRGAWYGHPNLQRGECAWVDPYTDTSASGHAGGDGYRKAAAIVASAATGIREYGATHFCGRLRGSLVVSRYKGGTSAVRVEEGGGTVESLTTGGGLSFVETANGDLVFPMLTEKRVSVQRAVVRRRARVGVVGVYPWRHGAAGGTAMTIAGWGFGEVRAFVDGAECVVVRSTAREIVCVVPPGRKGQLVAVQVRSGGVAVEIDRAVLFTMV